MCWLKRWASGVFYKLRTGQIQVTVCFCGCQMVVSLQRLLRSSRWREREALDTASKDRSKATHFHCETRGEHWRTYLNLMGSNGGPIVSCLSSCIRLSHPLVFVSCSNYKMCSICPSQVTGTIDGCLPIRSPLLQRLQVWSWMHSNDEVDILHHTWWWLFILFLFCFSNLLGG